VAADVSNGETIAAANIAAAILFTAGDLSDAEVCFAADFCLAAEVRVQYLLLSDTLPHFG